MVAVRPKNLRKIGFLTHEDGWMGGQWKLNGANVARSYFPKKVYIKFKGKLFKATPIVTHGVDYDHGHEYKWQNYDFNFPIDTDIGVIHVNLLDVSSTRNRIIVFQEQ